MATKVIFLILFFFNFSKVFANEQIKILDKDQNTAEIKIIDKITSRLNEVKLNIKTVKKIKDFEIYIEKCVVDERKGFRETSALIQIKDIKNKTKDKVFLFNDWMFATNPAVNELEHPNYDIWLSKCS